MKLFYTFLLFLFCVLGPGATIPATAATTAEAFMAANIVQNGSFENAAAFWSLPQKSVEVDNREAHIGTSSLRLAQTDARSDGTATQFLAVSPGDVLTATVWVKGQSLVSTVANGGATLALEA